jgi:hypothetical protein
MTPEVAAICGPIDKALEAILATVTRLEAQKQQAADDQQDLLAIVAARIESDPAFRYALAMLILD